MEDWVKALIPWYIDHGVTIDALFWTETLRGCSDWLIIDDSP
jgi:hypothetical protein